MKTREWTIVLAGLGLAAMTGCASRKSEAAPPPPPPAAPQAAAVPTPVLSGTVAEGAVTTSATVQAINQKTRMVTLKTEDGRTVSFKAGPDVKNLKQVKKGDVVTATYYESLAYDVMKKGSAHRGVGVASDVATAKPGEKPAVVGARAVTVTAKITGIDKKANTVTLKGPRGNSRTVKVQDPSKLDAVQVGDLVQITYTEAIGIAVNKGAK